MKHYIFVRTAPTKFGSKGHIRVSWLNVHWKLGSPPWTTYLHYPYARRITHGFLISVRLRKVFQFRAQWLPPNHQRSGRRLWLECPKCGWLNKRENFYRRTGPE